MIKTNLHKILLRRELDDQEPYTDVAVAVATGLHPETVSRFRRNITTRFDAGVLDVLCRVLDVTPGELLIYEPDVPTEDGPAIA